MSLDKLDTQAMNSLLTGTIQLHSLLKKSHSGVTRPMIHAEDDPNFIHPHHGPPTPTEQLSQLSQQQQQQRQQQQQMEQQRERPIGLGIETSIDAISHHPRDQAHGVVVASMTKSKSFGSSLSSIGHGSSAPPPTLTFQEPPTLSIPSSPTRSSFSSPQLTRLTSSSTLASLQDTELSTDQTRSSLPSDKGSQNLSIDTTSLPPQMMAESVNGTPYTRNNTRSFSRGLYQQPHLSPQPQTRRTKTSLSALANIDHNGRSVHHHLLNSSGNGLDPKDGTISINIRFVAKDLWIRVDIPRNISVQAARDLVLEKCHLTPTIASSSAPSSLAGTTIRDDDSVSTATTKVADGNYQHCHPSQSQNMRASGNDPKVASEQAIVSKPLGEILPDLQKQRPGHRSRCKSSTAKSVNEGDQSQSEQSIAVQKLDAKCDKNVRHSQLSLEGENIHVKNAEVIVARLDMFNESLCGTNPAKADYVKAIVEQPIHNPGHERIPLSTSHPSGLAGLSGSAKAHQQMKRLTSNNSIQDEDTDGTSPPDRISREGGIGRLGQLSGWNNWRDRHNSNLLELQLRDHYIQLPPEGSTLNYYDHYAEGILFKLSKKNRPVSLLTGSGSKESQGIWKERWVVLQGSKLHIYHKRKDINKKVIELPSDLSVVTRTLPSNSRPFFKAGPATGSLSRTVIVIDISSDPNVPKLCFRGASQHNISHWVRIFNSLNSTAPLSSPLLGAGLGGGFGSPNPDTSSARSEKPSSITNYMGYSPERKRNHTFNYISSNDRSSNNGSINNNNISPTVPSNNPDLISNDAGAISSQNNTGGNGNSSPTKPVNSHFKEGGLSANYNGPKLESRDPTAALTKEDIRRRAITEPNRPRLMNPLQPPLPQRGYVRVPSKGPSSEPEILEASSPLEMSNVSETLFQSDTLPRRKRRPVLGTEYLDNASQILLASSSARSSTAPLYSGYIWLYLPNASMDTVKSAEKKAHPLEGKTQNVPAAQVQGDGQLTTPLNEGAANEPILASPASPSASNGALASKDVPEDQKPIGSGTGRYVKCFALISDLGHFQWVEVKKLNDQETSEQELRAKMKGSASPTSSRSSYGIQLKSQKPAIMERDNEPGSSASPVSEHESLSPRRVPCDEPVQVSMMESVNMFFFCVKISPSVINDVLLNENIIEASSPPPHIHSFPVNVPYSPNTAMNSTGIAASAAKAASKIRHRLSSSLSTFTASAVSAAALPPLPTLGSKPQSLSGSISKGKNMAWPSITSPTLFDAEPSQDQTQQSRQNQHLQPERALAVPPSSSSSSTCSISHKGSYTSLKHGLPNIITTAAQQQQPDSNLVGMDSTPTQLFASPTSAESQSPATASSSSPPSSNSTSGSASPARNVLLLAQNLQEAVMLNRHQFHIGEGKGASDQPVGLGLNIQSTRSSPPSSKSSITSTSSASSASRAPVATSISVGAKPKITEAMVANQSAFPESAAMLERNKQMQEQAEKTKQAQEQWQRVQKAEERVLLKQQQVQQQKEQKENRLLNAQKQQCQQQRLNQQPLQQSLQPQQPQQLQQPRQLQQPQEPEQVHPPQVQAKSADADIPIEAKITCPFLELSRSANMDGSAESFVLLRGYTESEEEWKALQCALDRFLDGPVKRQASALPPQDTLIPSYHSPAEVKLSEKAEKFLSAKESMIEEANLAASKAAIDAARAPTPDLLSGGTIHTANGPVAQIRATSVSMTRWMNLSGGKDRDRCIDREIGGNKAKIDNKLACVEDVSPILSSMPATSPGTFGVSEGMVAPPRSEGSDAAIKRGITPPHSISAGSSAGLFQTRHRLGQQRSADELSKVLPLIEAVDSNGVRSQETSHHEEDPQLLSEEAPRSPKMECGRLGHRSNSGPRSPSLSSTTTTATAAGWEPSSIQSVGTTFARAMSDDIGDRLTLTSEKLELEGETRHESNKRDSKSSIQSLYSQGAQLAVREAENNVSEGICSRIGNNGKNDTMNNNGSNFDTVTSMEGYSYYGGIGSSTMNIGSLRYGILGSGPIPIPPRARGKKEVEGLHPLDYFENGRGNGPLEATTTKQPAKVSSSQGSSSKKHTVLGVGKAAVNGVLGKFRKSVS
ncbi:hypothetical protein BGZ80_001131 [Entomortierella chlamydospora]|uniref:PH domain-containing protein n=1 Tax=Entomortierella chlamydospora TaxID=101097 RepID=A0A9P6MR88_9FUNG|nr:hypothetical protein BGZ80_001131 [Entomortierella chlamydospora]